MSDPSEHHGLLEALSRQGQEDCACVPHLSLVHPLVVERLPWFVLSRSVTLREIRKMSDMVKIMDLGIFRMPDWKSSKKLSQS